MLEVPASRRASIELFALTFAILFLAIWFIAQRAELERRRQEADEAPEPARIPVAGRRVET